LTVYRGSKTWIDRIESLRSGSAELTQDFRIFREAAFVLFREDEFSIKFDIENPTAAGNEFGRDVVLLLDLGRQTGGLRFVVSTRAICNSDDHSSLPLSIIVESKSWDRALES
jgi:hypothetical protein